MIFFPEIYPVSGFFRIFSDFHKILRFHQRMGGLLLEIYPVFGFFRISMRSVDIFRICGLILKYDMMIFKVCFSVE